MVKNLPANAGDIRDASSITGLGRSSEERNGNSFHYFCLENHIGQRSLVDYNLYGCKESGVTEVTACKHLYLRIHRCPTSSIYLEKIEKIPIFLYIETHRI